LKRYSAVFGVARALSILKALQTLTMPPKTPKTPKPRAAKAKKTPDPQAPDKQLSSISKDLKQLSKNFSDFSKTAQDSIDDLSKTTQESIQELGDRVDQLEESRDKPTSNTGTDFFLNSPEGQTEFITDQIRRNDIPRPEEWVKRAGSAISYDQLSLAEFALGFYSCLEVQTDLAKQTALKRHYRILLEDAAKFDWPSVRAFHSSILTKLQQGTLRWSDSYQFDQLRIMHHISNPTSTPSLRQNPQNKLKEAKAKKKLEDGERVALARAEGKEPCSAFQSRMCQHPTHHESKLHLCKNCFYEKSMWYERHAEGECNSRQK
jgi:hypothetical protein